MGCGARRSWRWAGRRAGKLPPNSSNVGHLGDVLVRINDGVKSMVQGWSMAQMLQITLCGSDP